MANDKIVIKGAREHNLKNIDITLPRDKFIVMTGLSGSGKSSLAFDTIYADGLEVEVHYDPRHAWSDGAQCLTPDAFAQAMAKCRQVAWAIGRDM